MPEQYDLGQVSWQRVGYLLKPNTADRKSQYKRQFEYELTLPHFLAAWDVWDYWEKARVHSMREHLKRGDVLFDIGAEVAWCSIVYATMVGAENMVLVEPSVEFWPNIKATWQRNADAYPKACFAGFMSDKNTYGQVDFGWPASSSGKLIDYRQYSYLHVQPDRPQMTIDRLAATVGNPDALSIDIEGAELIALRGAVGVMSEARPLIWVSVHPDLALRDYGTTTEDLMLFLDSMEYDAERFAVDHEEHWLLTPR